MGLAIIIHTVLSMLVGIDADSTLICSTATIYGGADRPRGGGLEEPRPGRPGADPGLAGIALGNYLGLLTAWGLRWLAGG